MKKLQIAFLSIIFAAALFGEISSQETALFSEAKGLSVNTNDKYSFEKWMFSIGNEKYEINKAGTGKRIGEGNVAINFRLKVYKDDFIENVIYFARYKNDLLLSFEGSDGESSMGYFALLDGRTLKTKWQKTTSPGVGQGLIEDKFAYITGAGFIAKIDLETGKYIWKHEDLYEKHKGFASFLAPQIEDDTVIFKEEPIYYIKRLRIIKANKTDGRIAVSFID